MIDYPITPPPELVEQWTIAALGAKDWLGGYNLELIATQAARWGADQELEACCEWLDSKGSPNASRLRAARRPKAPSLKEQALAALQEAAYMADDSPPQGICSDQIDIIRRALEQIND